MARSAIPDFGIEYPPYEYHPWPKYAGATAEGEALIANNEKEYEELKAIAFFPKVMGKDRNGKDVIAQNPRDLEWLKSSVVTPPEDPEVVKKREADRLAAIAETERKAKAYDEMMARKEAADKAEAAEKAAAAASEAKAATKPAAAAAKDKAA